MMFICIARDSGGIRTHDPQLRRLLLYPTELRNHRPKMLGGSIGCAKVIFFFQFALHLINYFSHEVK